MFLMDGESRLGDGLGDAGLEFLQEMARDGRARVFATLNPAGMDMDKLMEVALEQFPN